MLFLLSWSCKLNWFTSLSFPLFLCISVHCMYVLQHSTCSFTLPCSLILLMCPPFLFSLLYIYSGLQTVCSQSQFFPRALVEMEGASLGREGKERENRGRIGVIVNHVEHVQWIYFKWERHKFVPFKKAKWAPAVVQCTKFGLGSFKELGEKQEANLKEVSGWLLPGCWVTPLYSLEVERALEQASCSLVFSDENW